MAENKEHVQALARLKKNIQDRKYNALAQEYTEEALAAFLSAEPEFIARLLELAHELVLHTEADINYLHPVYGAIINVFFHPHHRIAAEITAVFFAKAGQFYKERANYTIAQLCYRRVYEAGDNAAIAAINELELLNYYQNFTHYSLELAADCPADLSDWLNCFFNLVEALAGRNLQTEIEACYKLPLLTIYFDRLALKLQRLAGDNDATAIMEFEQTINDFLLPLAERINLHTLLNPQLEIWLSDCYQLAYNVIRDNNNSNLKTLSKTLMQHKNLMHQQKMANQNNPFVDPIKLPVLWHESAEKLASSVAEPITYTQVVKQVITVFCERARVVLGKPPCEFSLLGFGSITRAEMLASSDVDIYLLIAADNLSAENYTALRKHPYFSHYIRLVNQLLKLSFGHWLCTVKFHHNEVNAAGYKSRQRIYHWVDTGLRIDEMDVSMLAELIHEPKKAAAWVIKYSKDLNPKLKLQHRIVAYAMLSPVALYISSAEAEHLYADYLAELKAALGQYKNYLSYMLASLNEEWQKILNQWQQHKRWSLQHAYAFVKTGLLVLDVWSRTAICQVQKQHITVADFTERLDLLLKFSLVDKYFVNSLAHCRKLLLETKKILDTQPDFHRMLPWQELSMAVNFCLIPVAYQLKSHSFSSIEKSLNPFLALLSIQAKEFNYIELIPQAVIWMLLNQATIIDYERIYTFLLTTHNSQAIAGFVDGLLKHDANLDVAGKLMAIPNAIGYRQSERLAYQQLEQDLDVITQELIADTNDSMQVVITYINFENKLITRQLLPKLVSQLITLESKQNIGRLQRQYTNSRHAVAQLIDQQLHFKELPDQPMMDYAIDILHRRLIGHGTPANTVARLQVKINQQEIANYPVLISKTLGKVSLRQILAEAKKTLSFDKVNYTELVLVALLISSGDALSRNFVITEAEKELKLACIDNEQQFVEPVVKELSLAGINKVQLRNILFCLNEANEPLAKEVLVRFKAINNYNLISQWLKDVLAREQALMQLYVEVDERAKLYALKADQSFTTRLLLREGVLGGLLLNLNYLQTHISEVLTQDVMPTALELLCKLSFRAGNYYSQAFKNHLSPEQRLQAATGSNHQSLSSSLALKASLGIVPSFKDIEHETKYSLAQAKNELHFLVDFKPNFSMLIYPNGQPDSSRQLIMLKALALYPHRELDLSHASILTDELLEQILNKSKNYLRILNLRACKLITVRAIKYLAMQHPHLSKLYLSDCAGITKICNPGITSLTDTILKFPKLTVLHLSRCEELVAISIDAPNLSKENLKAVACKKLSLDKIQNMSLSKRRDTSQTDLSMIEAKLQRFSLIFEKTRIYIIMRSRLGSYQPKDAIKSFDLGSYRKVNMGDNMRPDTSIISLKSKSKLKINNNDVELLIYSNPYSEKVVFPIFERLYPPGIVFLHFVDVQRIEDSLLTIDNLLPKDYGDDKLSYPPIILISYCSKEEYGTISQDQRDSFIVAAKKIGAIGYMHCKPSDQANLKQLFIGSLEAALIYHGLWQVACAGQVPEYFRKSPDFWFNKTFFESEASTDQTNPVTALATQGMFATPPAIIPIVAEQGNNENSAQNKSKKFIK